MIFAAAEETAAHTAEGGASVSDVIFEHVSNARELDLPFIGKVELPEWYLFGVDVSLTKHAVFMFVSAALLLVVFSIWGRKRSLVPKGFYNLLEMIVLFIRDEIADKNIGHDGALYTPYLCTIFFFILFMNLVGLVPFTATATANLNVTVVLAAMTFFVTQYAAIRSNGIGGWLKALTGGVHWLLWPIMVPVEILGLFTKPFALTVRLFANMIAGHIVIFFLLGLIFLIHAAVAPVSIAFALGIFMLELFVALVQAYVFTMLSSLFIGMAASHSH